MLTKIDNGGYSIWTSSLISTEPSLLLQIKQIYTTVILQSLHHRRQKP